MKNKTNKFDKQKNVCYSKDVGTIQQEDKEHRMYQKLFNETLNKLRLILVATGNQNLMRAMVKVMFDFSDALYENNLLDKEQENETSKQ